MAEILPIIINVLLVALLFLGIILGIKLIITLNKVNKIADNIQNKVESLNGLFDMIDSTTGKLNFAYNKLIGLFANLIDKFTNKHLDTKEEEEEEDYE